MARAGARVLVVDRERLIRWSIVQALRRLGYEVEEAADGREALEKARGVDLAIVDRDLPDGDGAYLAEALKRRGSLRKVALTTTDLTDELVEDAAVAGIDAVLEKPFDLTQILELVEGAGG